MAVFLLSPANSSGVLASMLLRPGAGFEALVGLMLVVLGGRAVMNAFRDDTHPSRHPPGTPAHLVVFGLGSVMGMAALSGAAGNPLQRLQRSASQALLGLAGAGSSAFGTYWLGTALTGVFR